MSLSPRPVEEKLQRAAAQLRRFEFNHRPVAQQETAAPYYDLARRLVLTLPETGARRVAIDELLGAREAALVAVAG